MSDHFQHRRAFTLISIIYLSKLEDKGILIKPSIEAFFSKPHSHGFKVGYPFLNKEEMEDAIKKTATVIKELLRV